MYDVNFYERSRVELNYFDRFENKKRNRNNEIDDKVKDFVAICLSRPLVNINKNVFF